LDLGFTPPADQFLRPSQLKEPETYYPLEVMMCRKCGLAQLSYVVPSEVLYRRDYPYESSMTKSGQIHWDEFAETVCKTYNVSNNDLVVDIGSNVGVLLGSFKKQGAKVLGIDPASNIVRIAEKRGIETWDEFFAPDIASKVVQEKQAAKIITGTNVFAHVDDLKSFMKAVNTLLDPKGVFIFEAPYFGNLIKFLEYDTIYHEHLSYLLLEPIIHLVKPHNMEVIDVQERDIHGGSFRVFIARKGQIQAHERVKKFLENEINAQWKDENKLKEFANQVQQNRYRLNHLLYKLKLKGKKLAAVSAPAKGMTLLNYCRIGPETLEFISEKSTLKKGRVCPGTHIPVVDDAELVNQNIDYALLLAWNFSEEIMNNLKEYQAKGGKFIIPIPEPIII
jgi:2-polyprenyl-3-methyl-5-hydroxy-6-metoxy-1,4-benzoquinol methylase